MLLEEYNDITRNHNREYNQIAGQIKDLNERLNKARQRLFMEQIEAGDFKLMKSDCEKAIAQLERQMVGMASNKPKSIVRPVDKRRSQLAKT